ncbi:DUF664 domain-containing protein [Streptomyces sp. NPDC005181]|uniref:mycothiol transferase n=1 Tax=Streptomyces sp. NPDC005181 TaxID=3156869 RepID=UPI0033A3CEB0
MTGGAPPKGEVRALLAALEGQRRHVMGILDGLDAEALRRPVLPSGWNCLGLVQQLALDVERFWFRAVVAGEKDLIHALDDSENAWQVGPGPAAADVLERYRHETDLADAVIACGGGAGVLPRDGTRLSTGGHAP